jgi:hypothetical protein
VGGHVARVGEKRGLYRFLVGKPEVIKIILRWVFRKWDVGYGLDRAGSG